MDDGGRQRSGSMDGLAAGWPTTARTLPGVRLLSCRCGLAGSRHPCPPSDLLFSFWNPGAGKLSPEPTGDGPWAPSTRGCRTQNLEHFTASARHVVSTGGPVDSARHSWPFAGEAAVWPRTPRMAGMAAYVSTGGRRPKPPLVYTVVVALQATKKNPPTKP